MDESISLEETNKIRVSLGLKPLTEDGPPTDTKEKQAEDNYARRRDQEAKAKESKKIADRIAKVRNRHELNASLKGTTLGDADDGGDSASKWIKKSKKKEKELAKKRLEELENMDKMAQAEYTERDLEGLKVGHDFDELDEGDARILTLKDSRIIDNEEDELQNVEMAEEERHKKKQEMKIQKRNYTGYDDDEFEDGKAGMKRAVLSKYDEDLEGPGDSGFRLGNSAKSERNVRQEQQHQAAAAVNKSFLTIDYDKNFESSDYLKEGEAGFKKRKMKKKHNTRRAPAEIELADPNEMDVDEKPFVPRVRELDANFVDDDELQAALARSRRAKLRKAPKLTPEDLAQKVKRELSQPVVDDAMDVVNAGEAEDDRDEGLTFDDTAEFVRTVGIKEPPKVKREIPEPSLSSVKRETSTPAPAPAPARDASMVDGDEAIVEVEAGEIGVKEEEDEDDAMAMLENVEDLLAKADAGEFDNEELAAAANTSDGIGTSNEQTFKSGMAATLNILRQQGILAAPTDDNKERENVQMRRDAWLAQQRHRVSERELEKLRARGVNKDQATREYENRLREQQEARETMDAYKDYKPDVNIVYYDEHGRELSSKEAWKALSHKFHGKGSGKKKTEKLLKKIAEERKQAAMASGDTPLSMNAAFQQRQLKTGQAHFVLSVGNKGAVPQAAEFVDAQPLSKGKTEKTKRKKEAKKGKGGGESEFMTSAAPEMYGVTGSPTPADSARGSPMPKAGFSRIGTVAAGTGSAGRTPEPAERSKVAFGFGTKRKAADEGSETPPTKRR